MRARDDLLERELTGDVIAAFFHVYNGLGFGFLESNYCRALEIVLKGKGIQVEREAAAPVFFQGVEVGRYRVDLLVERRVIVEVKASEILPSTARRQLRNYLHAMRLQVGLILHFGPKPQFYRMVERDTVKKVGDIG